MATASNHLVGMGGLGFVMYHLAKAGIDFVSTSQNSDRGDLWVKTPEGIVEVEVKSSRSKGWRVRRKQIEKSKFVIFMSYALGRCWVVTHEEMMSIATGAPKIGDEVIYVDVKTLPRESLNGWGRLSSSSILSMGRLEFYPPEGARTRAVKKRLADGSIKTYHYPTWRLPKRKSQLSEAVSFSEN